MLLWVRPLKFNMISRKRSIPPEEEQQTKALKLLETSSLCVICLNPPNGSHEVDKICDLCSSIYCSSCMSKYSQFFRCVICKKPTLSPSNWNKKFFKLIFDYFDNYFDKCFNADCEVVLSKNWISMHEDQCKHRIVPCPATIKIFENQPITHEFSGKIYPTFQHASKCCLVSKKTFIDIRAPPEIFTLKADYFFKTILISMPMHPSVGGFFCQIVRKEDKKWMFIFFSLCSPRLTKYYNVELSFLNPAKSCKSLILRRGINSYLCVDPLKNLENCAEFSDKYMHSILAESTEFFIFKVKFSIQKKRPSKEDSKLFRELNNIENENLL